MYNAVGRAGNVLLWGALETHCCEARWKRTAVRRAGNALL